MARDRVGPMSGGDFRWAAGLMAQRRAIYEASSPVFWRPAVGPDAVPDDKSGLVAVGFRNPSEFYDGFPPAR